MDTGAALVASAVITSGVIATLITTVGVVVVAVLQSRANRKLDDLHTEVKPPGEPPLSGQVQAMRIMLRRHIRTAAVLEASLVGSGMDADDPIRKAFQQYLKANIDLLDEEDSEFAKRYMHEDGGSA